MNVLKGTRVYLAGSIENAKDGGANWRNYVASELEELNIKVYNPLIRPFVKNIEETKEARIALNEWMENGEYDKVAERMRHVYQDDIRLTCLSDWVFAVISPTVASWGTASELHENNSNGHPAFVVVEGGKKKTPLWLMGMLPHHYFYNSIDEALETIRKIDDGTIPIDSERWRILRPEQR